MAKVFSISTAEVPTIPFEVTDGKVPNMYSLRTMAHLTPAEEAEVKYLFKRDDDLQAEFKKTAGKDKAKLQDITDKLRAIRQKLIGILSDMPEDSIKKLNLIQHGKILAYIGRDPEEVIKEAAEADGSDISGIDDPEEF